MQGKKIVFYLCPSLISYTLSNLLILHIMTTSSVFVHPSLANKFAELLNNRNLLFSIAGVQMRAMYLTDCTVFNVQFNDWRERAEIERIADSATMDVLSGQKVSI